MRISVFGMGYVGATTSACLAKEGHSIIGVDPDEKKRSQISAGQSPIVEEGLDDLIADGVRQGRIVMTDDYTQAVAETEMSLICVGTPSRRNGSLRTDFLEKVAREIGEAIRKKGSRHSVVVRSTVLPGTTEGLVRPILEEATGGVPFGLSMNPEFLREGVSIYDFYNPPFTVIGTDSKGEFERVKLIYEGLPGEMIHCAVPTAEAMKYGCNIFHAIKITFANEMGMLCKRLGVDSGEVMDILCRDTKLNISARYMKPGFAFGGSCLPKDLRGYTYKAREMDVPLPMFEGILASNRTQIERVADRVLETKEKKVGMLGIAFKEGTDDLRESPLVTLAEILIGKGIDMRVFDPNVHYASLYGSNKEFIDRELPHLKKILVGGEEVLQHANLIIAGHKAAPYEALIPLLEKRHQVLDLTGLLRDVPTRASVDGLYW